MAKSPDESIMQAIEEAAALYQRLVLVAAPEEQISLFPEFSEEEWADLDGQEQMETLLSTRLKALRNERAEVKLLLEAAQHCAQAGPDAKAETLLEWIYRLQAEEGDPDLKVLVFTEFVPTQEMLRRFLSERGFSAVCLNGSMDMEERRRVQEAFAREARILVSTDAGGEGLNLQFCHVVVNYDIPWNPMRLEQRIGRVDRIGQAHPVRALNFELQDSVEHRVREVLEQKLAVILDEFGIDKTGDVLDSAEAGRMFDELYVEAILSPEKVDESVSSVVARLRRQVREARSTVSVLGAAGALSPGEAQRLLAHPLPYWVERMTVSWLKAHGGQAERKGKSWNLTWPDGETYSNVVFAGREAGARPNVRHLTLEDPRVRDLVLRLPRFVPGQPIPVVTLPGISEEIRGFWSIWRIAATAMEWSRWKIMPLFLSDNGSIYTPTARHLWDQLITTDPEVLSSLDADSAQKAFERMHRVAEEQGRPLYEALVREHKERMEQEREKAGYSFAARRRMIERVGLPQVHDHRLRLLAEEERAFQEQHGRDAQVYPELMPLLILRVEGGARE